MNYSIIGARIRQARKEKSMTQEEFAEKMGISVGYVNQVETGKKCFNLKRFKQAGVIFDKPVSYFIEGSACEDEDSLREIVGILTNANKEQINIVKKIVQAIVD
ncbi:MAG: helix-turn-helix transcriptional regulator [Clostridia bacterium]|nr:helix-turn-helix transcriptional regulator [Clostridia bacterium]